MVFELNPNWITAIATVVYVIATIFICFFNYYSAESAQEQTAEMRKQFEESNRANVVVTCEVVRESDLAFKVENVGKSIAENVILEFDEDFCNSLTEERNRIFFKSFKNRVLTLGIGQSFFYAIAWQEDFDKIIKDKTITVNKKYTSNSKEYSETQILNFTGIDRSMLYKSAIDDLANTICKKLNFVVDDINGLKVQINKDNFSTNNFLIK